MNNPYSELEKSILKQNRKLKVLKYLRPINESREKEKFLKEQKEPNFEYRTNPNFNEKEVRKSFKKIVIPIKPDYRLKNMAEGIERMYDYKVKFSNKKINKTLRKLSIPYLNVVKNIFAKIKILNNLGNSKIIKEETAKIYGIPSEDTVRKAKDVLNNLKKCESPKSDIKPEYVKKVMYDKIKEYGLDKDGWICKISKKKRATLTSSLSKEIKIGNRMYPKNILNSLAVHEVGVHAVLANNGAKQPFKIFNFGFPLQSKTNEGLATYFERTKDCLNDFKLKKYAVRCLAVYNVLEGNSFKSTFKKLRSYDLDEEMSWEISMRAHRGGGCIKDHIYFEGLEEIKNYNGSYKVLFTGRVSFNYVELIEEMMEKGFIKSPEDEGMIFPDFAKKVNQLKILDF